MNIVFMGSADFGIPALTALMSNHRIAGVVTTPAKAQGRGLKLSESPIALFAQKHGLSPVFKPESLKSEELYNQLASLKADLFVVVAFRILPRTLFSLPPLGTINIHASLLPKYRGPAPIHRAIEAGEHETGVTIFKIDEGIDTGEILLQSTLQIEQNETTPELYERLSVCGAAMLIDAIGKLESGIHDMMIQENLLSCKAPKLTKDEAHIDWNMSAESIFNKIRAFKPFPGTFCFLDGKRLGIDWAVVADNSGTGNAGRIIEIEASYFDVFCNPGVLRIMRVKPEGRKVMSVHDFLLGSHLMEGIILK